MNDRDELRAKAIEAMAAALGWYGVSTDERIPAATRAFDALHGIVRVVPLRCTTDMIGRAQSIEEEGGTTSRMIDAALFIGDLTTPPAEKVKE